MIPPGVDFTLPTVAFILIWGVIGMTGAMLGAKRSGFMGFALGAMVAGVWILYLATHQPHG